MILCPNLSGNQRRPILPAYARAITLVTNNLDRIIECDTAFEMIHTGVPGGC